MYPPRAVPCPRRDKKTNPPAGSDCGRTWNRLVLQNGLEVDGLVAGFDVLSLPRHGLAVATCMMIVSRSERDVNPTRTDCRGYSFPCRAGVGRRACEPVFPGPVGPPAQNAPRDSTANPRRRTGSTTGHGPRRAQNADQGGTADPCARTARGRPPRSAPPRQYLPDLTRGQVNKISLFDDCSSVSKKFMFCCGGARGGPGAGRRTALGRRACRLPVGMPEPLARS
jgi:hypothetical protein